MSLSGAIAPASLMRSGWNSSASGGSGSLEDMDNLTAPEVIAREIVEDLTAALVEFPTPEQAATARTPSRIRSSFATRVGDRRHWARWGCR